MVAILSMQTFLGPQELMCPNMLFICPSTIPDSQDQASSKVLGLFFIRGWLKYRMQMNLEISLHNIGCLIVGPPVPAFKAYFHFPRALN